MPRKVRRTGPISSVPQPEPPVPAVVVPGQPPAPLSSEAPPSGSPPIDAPASILEAPPSGSPPIDAPASILEESGVDASDDEADSEGDVVGSVGDQEQEQSPAQSAASTMAVALAAAAHADQATAKKKVQQIIWSFKPAARTFFRIIEAVKPKGNAGWELVATHLREAAEEFNRDNSALGGDRMCRGALTCKGDQLQRRFKALINKPKPTGNPEKGWEIVEAHRLAEIIREDAAQGNLGNRTYIETHTQIEQGSLSADGKRKLSDASDAASHIKKSGGGRFFKALEDRDDRDRDRHAAIMEVTNRQMELQSRQHREYIESQSRLQKESIDSFKEVLGKLIDKF
jgi:hypothetical protein